MKNLSLLTKIFLGYLLIIALFTSLIFMISFSVIRSQQLESLKKDLREKAIILRERFKPYITNGKSASLDSLVKATGHAINHRITIIAADGLVLADSERDPATMDNHLYRNEVQQALANGAFGASVRYSLTIKQEMMYVVIPLIIEDDVNAFVRISLWLTEIDNLVSHLKLQFFQSVLVMIFISLILAWLFSRTISTPLKKLVDFARQLPAEKFEQRLSIESGGEIGELSSSMNMMASEIHNLFLKREQDTDELVTIIESMREGLMVVDQKKRVLLANGSLRRIFNVSSINNKHIWEVVKSKEFLEEFDEMIASKKLHTIELIYENKTYSVGFAKKPNRSEVIAIFHDISESKELEIKKREFVSNVSHELRTPLTAIKGFIETLEDSETDSEKKHFLKIIRRNTDRLIHLVQDLLLLSRLESNYAVELEKTNLTKFIENIAKIFKAKSLETGIELKLAKRTKMYANIDRFKMEQVFINLIDNAFNYSDTGPITIDFEETDKFVITHIKDCGIGISKEDQERIFERFYVVNKARSRKLAGTGLGLSLVKHIIQLHKGKITVESQLGNGTTFNISIPK